MANPHEPFSINTDDYYQYYQSLFETVDTTSSFWQPLLKAIGRTQLELAGLQARQAQAVVHWAHEVMRPASPMDIFNANAQLWWTLAKQWNEVTPRVAAALNSAATSVAHPAVVPMPVKPSHDTLILLDRDGEGERARARKVA